MDTGAWEAAVHGVTTEHPHIERFSLMRINKLLFSLGKLNVEWVKSISF